MASLSFYNPALESAVDAYASRLLRLQSAQETVIDPSVGPYVTSVIRSSLISADDSNLSSTPTNLLLESMNEYESLIELIQDHCGMDPEVSREVLQRIALAVRTGVVTESEESTNIWNMSSSSTISHESNPKSYSLGSDSGLTVTSNALVWNDSFISLNSGMKPAIVHAGTAFGSEDKIRKTSPYSETMTNEVKYLFQDEGSRINEQAFGSSKGFSESGYSNQQTASPLLPHHTSDSVGGLNSTFPSSNIINPSNIPTSSLNLRSEDYIPVDLLGVIEDTYIHLGSSVPGKDTFALSTTENSLPHHLRRNDEKLDTNSEYMNIINEDQFTNIINEEKSLAFSGSKVKGKKGKNKATDIAAILFKPSRPRSNSVQETKSPKMQSQSNIQSVPSLSSLSYSHGYDHYSNNGYVTTGSFAQNIEATVQMLLSVNPTICEEAAYEAAVLANADINIAQHVIDSALSAPAVCRHMLNDSCYRSDCQFSHDVDGHTCLFWLKGRCGKGDGCRFLHGYSHKLLDDVNVDYVHEYMQKAVGVEAGNRASTTSSSTVHQPIQTANLVQHNMATTTRQGLNRSASFDFQANVSSFQTRGSNESTSTVHFNTSMWKSSSNTPTSLSIAYTQNKEENNYSRTRTNVPSSFASIASKGYSETSFSCYSIDNSDYSTNDNSFVRIPQELWNANHNRSPTAFQILDPIARYSEVARSVIRDDIIDLHFQSLKTFPVVLSQILPEKLRQYKEVWIVSGSGHHVSRNSHQKSGGVLDNAVIEWLYENEYNFTRGKDKNGFGGAVLVKR